jgi:hypothetical protein
VSAESRPLHLLLPESRSIPKPAGVRDNCASGADPRAVVRPQGAIALQDKARFIQPAIVAAIMAFLMTAVITYINLGLPPDFLRRWMHAFVIAWPFATLAAFIAIPIARRATIWIVGRLDKAARVEG